MTTTFVTSSYESLAAELGRISNTVNRLAVEKAIIKVRFSEEGLDLTAVCNKITDVIDNEIASLNQAAEGFSAILQKKLQEPVEEKLGLGTAQAV